jgi:sporulation protein YlmC with PRC-barrel domain
MLEEAGNLIGLEVYTPGGIFVGVVNDLTVDLGSNRVDCLYLGSSSPVLVEHGAPLNIPFRWVQSIGDVIILRAFPEYVSQDSLPGKRDAKVAKRKRVKR